jgi:hypothetical protein
MTLLFCKADDVKSRENCNFRTENLYEKTVNSEENIRPVTPVFLRLSINTLVIKRWHQELGIREGVVYFQTDKGRRIQTHSYRITAGRAISLVFVNKTNVSVGRFRRPTVMITSFQRFRLRLSLYGNSREMFNKGHAGHAWVRPLQFTTILSNLLRS